MSNCIEVMYLNDQNNMMRPDDPNIILQDLMLMSLPTLTRKERIQHAMENDIIKGTPTKGH